MGYEHRKQATSAEQPGGFDSQTFFKEHFQRASDGKLEIIGDDLSPMELALLETEKRRRGSQSAVTREKMRADTAAIELENVKSGLPPLVSQIDENLRYSDPDEYIKQSIAAATADPYKEVFDTASQQANQTVSARSVAEVIREHNIEHPDKPLSEDMLNLDLPPRLLNDFSQGQMSPQEFLGRAADILYRPKEVANPDLSVTPNIGDVGGQTTPTSKGSNDSMIETYANAVF